MLIALVPLNYPAKFNQFMHGFQFSMLPTPDAINFAKSADSSTSSERPFTERLDEFGFSSTVFLRQQLAFCLLITIFASARVVLALLKKPSDSKSVRVASNPGFIYTI